VLDLPSVTQYLSTGCTILDLAIAGTLPGGFPVGRISHIYGPESASKSVLAMEPLGSAQRQGGIAWYIDAEGTFDEQRALLYGIDVEKLEYISSMNLSDDLTIEYLFDDLLPGMEERAEKAGGPCAVSIDSLSAIPSQTESDEGIGEATYGTSRAKMLSKGFRKHIWTLSKTGLTMLFVDQVRQNVGVSFGKKYVFSGGEALKFYASVRVLLSVVTKIKNKDGKTIGVEIGFSVDKNKIAPPFREGHFLLLFDYGIDDIATNIKWLRENDPEMPSKGWYEFNGKRFRSMPDFVAYIEDNDLEEELIKRVHHVWNDIYSSGTERKPRKRLL